MKKSVSLRITVLTLVLLAVLVVLPVSSAVDSPATTPVKPFVSVSISPVVPVVGDTAYVAGVAQGGNLTAGVQIWVFAGNYVNVTTVPLNADGYSYKQIYQTGHLPPATYYVFVQSPAIDGQFDVDFIESGKYTGQVVNTRTNTMILNFTGVGSVLDKDASQALSNALNQPGMDDVYSKAAFQLVAPTAISLDMTTAPTVPATTAAPAAPTTAKSPLPVEVTAGALVISGCCAAFCMRKTH
ncbi:MAG: hypothetical protein WCH85_07140 [Methanomicrobiales archaeon]